jgi:hypothetical protein
MHRVQGQYRELAKDTSPTVFDHLILS